MCSRRIPRAFALVAALAALPALTPAAPAQAKRLPGKVLFSDGFERGWSAWKMQALSRRTSLTSRNAADGRRAARFEVRPGEPEPGTGSERAEVYLEGPHFRVGQTLYVADSIRLGSRFVATEHFRSWRIVQQIHETGMLAPPGLAVFIDSGPRFGLRSGTSRPSFWHGPRLRRGRWYRLVYAVHLARNPKKGWVRVWLDGKPQTLTNGRRVMRGTTLKSREAFFKMGLYRSSFFTDTSVVYHDDVTITARSSRRAARR